MTCRLEHTANDAFLLRAFLTLKKHAQGEELAVCVDVRHINELLAIDSDVCLDDGTIIAEGPSAELPWSEGESNCADGIGDWFREFERFLHDNEPAVSNAAARLT